MKVYAIAVLVKIKNKGDILCGGSFLDKNTIVVLNEFVKKIKNGEQNIVVNNIFYKATTITEDSLTTKVETLGANADMSPLIVR